MNAWLHFGSFIYLSQTVRLLLMTHSTVDSGQKEKCRRRTEPAASESAMNGCLVVVRWRGPCSSEQCGQR